MHPIGGSPYADRALGISRGWGVLLAPVAIAGDRILQMLD
jgi:hypothetical protein